MRLPHDTMLSLVTAIGRDGKRRHRLWLRPHAYNRDTKADVIDLKGDDSLTEEHITEIDRALYVGTPTLVHAHSYLNLLRVYEQLIGLI